MDTKVTKREDIGVSWNKSTVMGNDKKRNPTYFGQVSKGMEEVQISSFLKEMTHGTMFGRRGRQ